MMRTNPKALLPVFFLLLTTLLLTGCWDNMELNRRVLVMAIGIDTVSESQASQTDIDLSREKNYTFTFLIARPGQLANTGGNGSGGGGSGQEDPFITIGAEAATLLEAVESVKTRLSRSMFFGYLEIIVFSEEVAKKDLSNLLQEISRSADISDLVNVAVAREQSARQVLDTKPALEKMLSGFVAGVTGSQQVAASLHPTRGWDFERDALEPGAEGVLMGIQAGKDQLSLSHLAVFQDTKMVGWLGPRETEGFNYLTGEITGFSVPLPSRGKANPVIIRDIRGKTSIQPEIKGDQVTFKVEVLVEGNLGKASSFVEGSVQEMREMRSQLEDVISKTIDGCIAQLKRLESDAADLGRLVRYQDPQLWQENDWSNNWTQAFLQSEIDVTVDARIRRKGMIQ